MLRVIFNREILSHAPPSPMPTMTVRRSGPVAWAMLIEPVYRGYRIEVQASWSTGRWRAAIWARRWIDLTASQDPEGNPATGQSDTCSVLLRLQVRCGVLR
jgi:hypothetical protein